MTNVTFPQLIQRGCGIDVHLKVVVATIDGVGIRKETRTFDTFTSCLTEMKEWLLANGITHVAMESTGVYWKPVMRVLEADIPNVWIVNARHIKNVPGHNNQTKSEEITLPSVNKLSVVAKTNSLHLSSVSLSQLLDNDTERIQRYISLSRRNSMFFGSHEGASRAAILYSIVISCKLNGINLFEYIRDVIEETAEWQPNTPLEKYRDLLPDRWKKQ